MSVKRRIVIELPIPMPSWNRILAMHHFKRKAIRDMLHSAALISMEHGLEWPEKVKLGSKMVSKEVFINRYMDLLRPRKTPRG